MTIIAIDPGTLKSAFVIFDGHKILDKGILSNDLILAKIQSGFSLSSLDDTSLAIEMVASYGMPVGREVFETILWIGRFYQAWLSQTAPASTVIASACPERLVLSLPVCDSQTGGVEASRGEAKQPPSPMGTVIASAARQSPPITLVYRKDVKLHHCLSPRANDATIRQALIDKYGAPGTKSHPGLTYGLSQDMWSAFAIAAYYNEIFWPSYSII